MSQLIINDYLADLEQLKRVSGTERESVVREAFKDLLKKWGRQQDLVFIPEFKLDLATEDIRFVDGALVHESRVPFGYWEAKDAKDDLESEIAYKLGRGYPDDNIIFEDSVQAVLIQQGKEVHRCEVTDVAGLQALLKAFFGFERAEIVAFKKAVAQFRSDLPQVLATLRGMIEQQHASNAAFRAASLAFLAHAREAINPDIGPADVREMLIQHILTEDIFSRIFDDSDFHRQNNVARKLYDLEETCFTGSVKKSTLRQLMPYYSAIRSAAARISGHREKQTFLKVIYENFYRVYNEKAADRLGVVYTPNEIVRFMIDGADWLCEKHFARSLIDENVEILDPATGTGTFISELLEHFRGSPRKLRHKYSTELHANEVAILPYYVANLNIEATYAAITGEYVEFTNLCFVDTLDNVGQHTAASGEPGMLFGSVSEENVARIRRQNTRKISVIIGNPPYNANQASENDNNKNRTYPETDDRIRQTYIAKSAARKTKVYDMYSRFYRWASDRVADEGVIAFVTNRSFIDSRTFDGFRRTILDEFGAVYVVDLGGDVRQNPRLSGTKHNVFGIQTGVAVCFLVRQVSRKASETVCRLYYARREEEETAEDKLAYLGGTRVADVPFEELRPDSKGNWLNVSATGFEQLVPLIDADAKAAKSKASERAIFRHYGNGINTARDSWIVDISRGTLKRKVRYLLKELTQIAKDATDLGTTIKWSRNLKRKFRRGIMERFDEGLIRAYAYRPYITRNAYLSSLLVDELGQSAKFDIEGNLFIAFSGGKGFSVLASSLPVDFHYVGDAKVVGRVRLDSGGNSVGNVTDWACDLFTRHYVGPGQSPTSRVTKDDIFAYSYAVLHDPEFRQRYRVELQRELPRIPLYGRTRQDFAQWVAWGNTLLQLHSRYGEVVPFPLTRSDRKGAARVPRSPSSGRLKADRTAGSIRIDDFTTVSGIPAVAWMYKLGNRSALEWVVDQYKERSAKDRSVPERLVMYRLADHKEDLIGILRRVTTVSVETMAIIEAMGSATR